jgi:hypothetical protein
MKKFSLSIMLLLMLGVLQNIQAQSAVSPGNENITGHKKRNTGEKIFVSKADKCLSLMEQAAQKLSVKGVALIAFIPGEVTNSWISKMKVVGTLTDSKSNLLAIANSKASEMADTHIDSGSGSRSPKAGEFGYKGGITKKVSSGYIIAVFSGGSGEQDVEIAKAGMDYLITYYRH